MTSIRLDNFEKIIARINSSPKPKSSAEKIEAGVAKEFQMILRDLENVSDEKVLSELARGDSDELQLKEPLTNLTLGERGLLRTVGYRPEESTSFLDEIPDLSSIQHVKNPYCSVKSLSLLSPSSVGKPAVKAKTVETGQPPTAPELIGAERVSEKPGYSLSKSQIEQIISADGRHHGIDPHLSMAVAKAESAYQTNAVSKDGHHSKGLFQLLDTTGMEMMKRLDVKKSYEPFNPILNSHLGVGYLRHLHDVFSQGAELKPGLRAYPARSAADLEKLAVAAFNAGEGNVSRAQQKAILLGNDPGVFKNVEKHLTLGTRDYVSRVERFQSEYQTLFNAKGVA